MTGNWGSALVSARVTRSCFCFSHPRVISDLGLPTQLTNKPVEIKVLERVRTKASHYGEDLTGSGEAPSVNPDLIRDIYRDIIIPLTKEVEVDYLLERVE